MEHPATLWHGARSDGADDPILQRMAGEYSHRFYGYKDTRRSLNILADWALRGTWITESSVCEGKGRVERVAWFGSSASPF